MTIYSGVINNIRLINESFAPFVEGSFNLELIIPEQGEVVFNPVTGNYEMSEQTEKTYQARVKKIKEKEDSNIVGAEFDRLRLSGYLVSPLNFVEELPKQIKARLLNDGNWLTGSFFRELSIEPELTEAYETRKVLGDKIVGYFQLIDNLNA